MKILSSPGLKTDIGITSSIPFSLIKQLYPFGTPEYRRDEHGSYLTQKFETRDFSFHFFRFDIIDTVTLYPLIEQSSIGLNFMLQGSIPAQIPGYGKRMLVENESEMFYLPAGETELTLEKGLYESCFLELTPDLISGIAEKHESIRLLREKLKNGSQTGWPSVQVKITSEAKTILKEMHDHQQIRPERIEVILLASVYKLLSFYENSLDRQEQAKNIILPGLEKKLLEIKQYIIDNANIHDCSFDKLSSMFHLAKDTLKVNFKKRFGMTVFQFVQSKCMEEAKRLLISGDMLVSDIAADLGYSNQFNFSNAFKKYYGVSPLQMKHTGDQSSLNN